MLYCTSCGSPIPEGQGKSCSMCYGDLDYGRDGYYRAEVERDMQRQAEHEQAEHEQADHDVEDEELERF